MSTNTSTSVVDRSLAIGQKVYNHFPKYIFRSVVLDLNLRLIRCFAASSKDQDTRMLLLLLGGILSVD